MIDEIITDILKAEGWDTYTDHPADKGGPTKWGITLKAWGDYLGQPVSAFNIQGITEAEARLFYHRKYILEPRFTDIQSHFLLACVVDAAVNHGPKRATKWLQEAAGVTADGVLGPVTASAVNRADDICLALKFLALRVRFYGAIISRDHSQAVFAKGWNARAAKWLERLVDHYTCG